MKQLFVAAALFLFTFTANAGTVFVTPNQAGGVIALTDSECAGIDDALLAYKRGKGGITVFGCWTYSKADKMFFVFWYDGQNSSYPAGTMVITDYAKRVYSDTERRVQDDSEITL